MKAFAALGMALAIACVSLHAHANECTLRNAARLPMLDGYPGRVVVEVAVAGRPLRFPGRYRRRVYIDLSACRR